MSTLSFRHKTIFIHIPKTGGTSIESALGGGRGHWDIQYMLWVSRLTDVGDLKNFFKFSFVRNPFDRLVSLYFYHNGVPEEFKAWFWKQVELDQYSYICDKNGKLVVDFIGRFENLYEDWNNVCEKIGSKLELPWIRTGKHKTKGFYKDYYDDDMKEKLFEQHSRDFREFGYIF